MTTAFQTAKAAILAQAEGWQDVVLENMLCMHPGEWPLVRLYSQILTGGASSFAGLTGDPADNAALAAALAAAGGALPSWDDQEVTTLLAVAQGDPLTATGLSNTPTGRIDVYSPGGQRWRVGAGVKTKDIYFSGDAGVTARAHVAIVAGDIPYLGTTGAAAGGVAAGEVIAMCYTV